MTSFNFSSYKLQCSECQRGIKTTIIHNIKSRTQKTNQYTSTWKTINLSSIFGLGPRTNLLQMLSKAIKHDRRLQSEQSMTAVAHLHVMANSKSSGTCLHEDETEINENV